MIIFNEITQIPFRMFEIKGKVKIVELDITPKEIKKFLQDNIETHIKNNLPKKYSNKKVNCTIYENQKPFGMGKFYLIEINPIIENIRIEFIYGEKNE